MLSAFSSAHPFVWCKWIVFPCGTEIKILPNAPSQIWCVRPWKPVNQLGPCCLMGGAKGCRGERLGAPPAGGAQRLSRLRRPRLWQSENHNFSFPFWDALDRILQIPSGLRTFKKINRIFNTKKSVFPFGSALDRILQILSVPYSRQIAFPCLFVHENILADWSLLA